MDRRVETRKQRVLLFEAAHVMLKRSTLKAWAMNVTGRRGAKRAKVARARKLTMVLRRIWPAGAVFCYAPGKATVATAH